MPRPLSLLLSFLLAHATGLAQPLPADSLTAPKRRTTCGWGWIPLGRDRSPRADLGLKPKTVYELVREFFRSFER